MANNTYVPLRQTTLTSDTATVTFDLTGLSSYTDLRIVINAANNNTSPDWSPFSLYFNGDNSSGAYSDTVMVWTGASTTALRHSAQNYIRVYSIVWNTITYANPITLDIMNYKSSQYKTVLYKGGLGQTSGTAPQNGVAMGLWKNTNAITSISFNTTAFRTGSTFSLYGIQSWAAESTPKASGGYVYSDSTYWYHSFPFSGTFTPNQALTADILVVAGGGSNGTSYGSGAGAGGLLGFTSQSLSATGYTVTVGAGAAATTSSSSNGNTGSDSQFGALTLVKGGGYGAGNFGGAGGNGGSGGGGSYGSAGGTATSGQGNAGGTASSPGVAGGGGAGAVGGNGVGAGGSGSGGGNGISTYSSWGAATGTGENVAGTFYYAGGGGSNNAGGSSGQGGLGGGGGAQKPSYNGAVSTGGGAGHAGDNVGRAGGSGIVIVRYAK